MGPRRPLLVVLFLTIFAAIVFVARYGTKDGGHLKQIDSIIGSGSSKPTQSNPTPCSEQLTWLEPYQFSYPIQYVSRDIITTPSGKKEKPSVTIVDELLFDDFTTVDSADSTPNIANCLPPLHLQVVQNKIGPTDASNMIFGLQTTIDRLKDTVKHLARWLPNTEARLFAIVIETEEIPAEDGEMKRLEKEFADLGMKVTILHPVRKRDTFPQRYFSLVPLMYAARGEKTQWITLIDDDTLFPSLHDLQNELSKYDATKPQYIGSLSEDWWAVKHYGLMGFGGAGIMLSVPMAKIIDEHLDNCKENLRTSAGDITVMDCVYRHTSTKLIHVPGLHQVDMHGDLSGFYESGREMLSLHHWKEGSAAGYKLEMEKMHLVADVCDSCFLQRWQFPKETILTNGFSISVYPQGHISGQNGVLNTGVGAKIKKVNLDLMEQTWGDDIEVTHSLAPTRPKLDEEAKISYKLLDSMLVKNDPSIGGKGDIVRQIYFKEGMEKDEDKKEMDTVMVLNWRKGEQQPIQTNL
jgi:hypothetical protein